MTQTWSERFSSTIAPKMMLASGCAASLTAFAASLTSHSERSLPPVIESRIERAPSIEVSSSGEETAAVAASIARCSPWPMPIPSSAVPAPDITVRTSAKSRLIRPGQRDEVGDALHALAQHVVGDAERLDHRGLLVEHREQAVVGHDDQRVDLGAERLDPGLGLVGALGPLEAERLRHDADGQRADLAARCAR